MLARKRLENTMSFEKSTVAVMFLDVKGYSKLTEPQLQRFLSDVLPQVGALIDTSLSPKDLLDQNSWGDAVIVASDDVLKMTKLALAVRDLFNTMDWIKLEMPRLALRIALHSGPM